MNSYPIGYTKSSGQYVWYNCAQITGPYNELQLSIKYSPTDYTYITTNTNNLAITNISIVEDTNNYYNLVINNMIVYNQKYIFSATLRIDKKTKVTLINKIACEH
jgi:hypothetical protein